MSGSYEYRLTWNNHHANQSLAFDQFLQTASFADMTLSCEGGSIKCHKMVLATCSFYFEKLLMENNCAHPIVILKDVTFAEMKGILEFMYKGEVNIPQDQLAGLLKLAETLRVKGIVAEDEHQGFASPEGIPCQSPNHNSTSTPQVSELSSGLYQRALRAVAAAEMVSSMQPPVWSTPNGTAPSPLPNHNGLNENSQKEQVPVALEKGLGTSKDTPILSAFLGHTSLPLPNIIEPFSLTASLYQKESLLNQPLISNPTDTNIPIQRNEKKRKLNSASPERTKRTHLDEVIISDNGHDDKSPPKSNDLEDKSGNDSVVSYIQVQEPKSKPRRYKQYKPENIMSAIETVKQGTSALEAARMFNVPSRTLYDKVKRLGIQTYSNSKGFHGSTMSQSTSPGHSTDGDTSSTSPEEQSSSDLSENGDNNGTGSFSDNGSEADCGILDSEYDCVNLTSMNSKKEDSNNQITDDDDDEHRLTSK